MEIDYRKLAEQYGGFLIAIGGVSITVLTLVLSAWRIQRQTRTAEPNYGDSNSTGESGAGSNRPALVISLIIATFNSFAGAQLMAETVAFVKAGPTHFLWASVNIFIGVSVIIFAVMLLTTEYRKETEVKGVRKMSRGVFRSVLISVICWMFYSVICRMPPPAPELALPIPLGLVAILIAFLIYLKKKKKLNQILLPSTFIAITSFTLISLLAFPFSLKPEIGRDFRNWTVGFFVLAITSTCFLLWFSARCCVGTERDDCHLWPPQGWRCWILSLRGRCCRPTTKGELNRERERTSRKQAKPQLFQSIGYSRSHGQRVFKHVAAHS